MENLISLRKKMKRNQVLGHYSNVQNLWEEIEVLYDEADDLDDDLKIQVWNEIVNMVNNNCKEFCEVTAKNKISALLNKISSESNKVTNTFLKDSVSSLQGNVETTNAKINSFEKQ